eukprot:75920-Pyramimonas_sp.AAC.1
MSFSVRQRVDQGQAVRLDVERKPSMSENLKRGVHLPALSRLHGPWQGPEGHALETASRKYGQSPTRTVGLRPVERTLRGAVRVDSA